MSNRSDGSRFENQIAEALSRNGFWVHILQQNKAGQPADLIVCRGQYTTLIDCKVISGGYFPLSRVEENQQYAMKLFSERTENACWFAMELPDGCVRLVSSIYVFSAILDGASSIPNDVIHDQGLPLEVWMEGAFDKSGMMEDNGGDDLK